MIPRRELRRVAREQGVPETRIERDYAQNWLLKHLSSIDMVFKGGTGIRKVYIDDYRFSDDLDYTLLEEPAPRVMEKAIKHAVQKAEEESGIEFHFDALNENINGFEGAIYFRILRRVGSPLKVKIDLTIPDREEILLPLEQRRIIHPYSDACTARVKCYSLEETVAEKIRGLFQRTRPRDMYDIWALWGTIDTEMVKGIIPQKCELKQVHIDPDSIHGRKEDFRSAWETSLVHQLDDVPAYDDVFGRIIHIIDTITV